ncbi:glycerol-3-phosphate dehydrogenase [NAD(+)], cytoplasmic-like [Trichosurus vulpecula]|uniref:glycerol-3-phosphate dehydrogenase [NAD(+)], cytoplasmic-like n=1 Tax=Trichosurus vulpecula TaxID=9337 RepID=UPI00186B16A0|nr:glycerol-3-phosphate dehydrogenase [NAD(+)], cytoplasmic-like [Trichosurus vulpecula]
MLLEKLEQRETYQGQEGLPRKEEPVTLLFPHCECGRGSAIAKIIGSNVMNSRTFDEEVKLWVFEETVDGRNLSDIINEEHENTKYLPGYKLTPNVVAVPDLVKAVSNADILVFITPHEFISKTCSEIAGHLKPEAFGISLSKGIQESPGSLRLSTDIIREMLGIEISVLMGANIAKEVADEKFCEATIGCTNKKHGNIFKELFETDNFRMTVVEDDETVELCGALKNVVALGAGFIDGLEQGDNTKAAVIRLGLLEMISFAKIFCKRPVQLTTFLESCGIADLITTCYGGRSRKVAEAFARTGKSIEELEKEILNGQKLQGPPTVREIYKILKSKNMENKFPIFVCIYEICCEGKPVNEFICCLRNLPQHKSAS